MVVVGVEWVGLEGVGLVGACVRVVADTEGREGGRGLVRAAAAEAVAVAWRVTHLHQ